MIVVLAGQFIELYHLSNIEEKVPIDTIIIVYLVVPPVSELLINLGIRILTLLATICRYACADQLDPIRFF